MSGAEYELSFEAWMTSDTGSLIEFTAKVGGAIEPYPEIYTWDPQVSVSRTRFTAHFVPDVMTAPLSPVSCSNTSLTRLASCTH